MFTRALAFVAAAVFSLTALAASPEAYEGHDYARLNNAQPVATGKKIEVLDFFWYRCPHCFQLEPGLDKWLKTRPKDAQLRRVISTVNAVIGDEVLDTGFHGTTPDAHDVQRYLAKMVEAGLTHVVLETTSHGWSQHRVDACEFDIGVVTNITHEHMNEHGNYENYRAAKARLFTSLVTTLEKPQGNPGLVSSTATIKNRSIS